MTMIHDISVLDGAYAIAVYSDGDGHHAEVWDERRQLVCYQSGDRETEQKAIDAARRHLGLDD